MKKVLAVFLSACLVLSLSILAFGAPPQNPPQATSLGHSIQGITTDNTKLTPPQATPPSTIKKNASFDVVIPAQNFAWSNPTGTGGYSLGTLFNVSTWITLNQAGFTAGVPRIDTANGNVTVPITATRAYDNVALTIGMTDGIRSIPTRTVTLTVEDDTVIPPVTTPSTVTGTKSGTAPTMTSHSSDTISLNPGDTMQWSFPLDNFTWSSDGTPNPLTVNNTDWIRLSTGTKGTDFKVSYSAPSSSSNSVVVTLTALKASTYSNLRVYLQSGNTATAYSNAVRVTVANSGGSIGKIDGIAGDAALGGTWSGALLNGSAISYSDLGNLEIKPDDELLLPLYAGFFTWNGNAPYAYSPVTTSQLNSGKVKVTSSNKKGSQVFESGTPEIVSKNGQAHIKIKFAKTNASTKDVDFSLNVYLSVSGKRHSDSYVQIAGSMVKEIYEIDSDSDYIDISDGTVVEATSYARNVELYLGEGVSVIASLTSGRKYAGTASYEYSSADERLMDQYPSIEQVITLKTTNLNRAGNKVILDYPGERYYVYDADGKYLGRSNEKLAYSSKYYLSTKQISFGSESLDPDDPEPVPTPGYNNGGDDVPPSESNYPQGRNDNPATGR